MAKFVRSTAAEIDAARLVAAAHARDVDDLRDLLSTLGLSGTKICTGCREELVLDEFHREARSGDGRRAQCRSCTRIDQLRHREHRARHRARTTL